MRFEWELIHDRDSWTTMRAKVPGGWLVSEFIQAVDEMGETTTNCTSNMVFVADPTYLWVIEEEEKTSLF